MLKSMKFKKAFKNFNKLNSQRISNYKVKITYRAQKIGKIEQEKKLCLLEMIYQIQAEKA